MRRGVHARVIVACLAMFTVAACSVTVSGAGRLASALPPTAPVVPTRIPSSAPSFTGSSEALAHKLNAPPAGSQPWPNTWGKNAYPTIAELVDYLYDQPYQGTESDVLQANGADAITHRTWIAADASQLDTVLVHFTTPAGAQAQFDELTEGLTSNAGTTDLGLTVPGYTTRQLQAFVDSDLDRDGNSYARVVAVVGDIVLEEYSYTPAHVNMTDLRSWTIQQLSLLK